MEERSIARHLAGAELWARVDGGDAWPGSAAWRGDPPATAEAAGATGADATGGAAASAEAATAGQVATAGAGDADGSTISLPEVAFISGWEDGEPFCATICSTDVGLNYCRQCPRELAAWVLATGRAGQGRCQAGGRLLGFPAPRGSRTSAAILRVGPPTPRAAAAAAERTRVAADSLRQAARQAPPPNGRAALAAAHALRDPVRLFEWQIQQRAHGSDRRRKAAAVLAQMLVTSKEFYDLYRNSQRQRRELERYQRRLDRLARQTLRASDLERARIAHQIHDTAAQSMVSAFRFLDAARAHARSHPADSIDTYLEDASDRLVTAIKEVRAVLADLMPPGLEELGLGHAIRGRVAALAAESGLEMTIEGDLPRLEGWVEQALYGMTAEALTNAVRHAGARTVRTDLTVAKGRAVITVQDDGQGFDPAAAERRRAGGGLGLLGISRQARWLGGSSSVHSRPGGGTTVRVSIPIARHAGTREDYAGASTDPARAGESEEAQA
jgi:signal transduction histidine kinase